LRAAFADKIGGCSNLNAQNSFIFDVENETLKSSSMLSLNWRSLRAKRKVNDLKTT
jgi:hypothetical protein